MVVEKNFSDPSPCLCMRRVGPMFLTPTSKKMGKTFRVRREATHPWKYCCELSTLRGHPTPE